MVDQIYELISNLDAVLDEKNPEPVSLFSDTEEAFSYPLHALPRTMRESAMAIAEHVQASPALAAQVVIGAAVSLAQTRANAPCIDSPDGKPCSMFLLTLANSGARKSAARKLAFNVLDNLEYENRRRFALQMQRFEVAIASMNNQQKNEYLSENPLPKDPRTQYGDVTFEKIVIDYLGGMASACWDTDEGAQLFGGHSMKANHSKSILAAIAQAFDTGFFDRSRCASNVNDSGVVYHRRLSILLLSQEITITQELNDPILRGQGFLPRFLFTRTESLAGTRFLTKDKLKFRAWDDPRILAYWERCKLIQAMPEYIDPDSNEVKPPVMQMSEAAEEVWLNFYNETEAAQAILGEFFQIQPFASRAGELVHRLATVFAVFELSNHIDDTLMRSACEIVRHTIREWRRFNDKAQPSNSLVQARALFQWLIEPHRINDWMEFHKNELSNKSPVRSRAPERDKCLNLLVQHKYLLTEDKKHYRINPRALSAERAENAQTPINTGFDSMEQMRSSAEILSFYAPVRKDEVPVNPDNSQPCAVSAVSAGVTQAKAIDDAEFF